MAPEIDHFGVRNRHRDSTLDISDILLNSGPFWELLGAHLASQNGAKIDPGASQTAFWRPEGLRRAPGSIFDRLRSPRARFSTDFRPIFIDFLMVFRPVFARLSHCFSDDDTHTHIHIHIHIHMILGEVVGASVARPPLYPYRVASSS